MPDGAVYQSFGPANSVGKSLVFDIPSKTMTLLFYIWQDGTLVRQDFGKTTLEPGSYEYDWSVNTLNKATSPWVWIIAGITGIVLIASIRKSSKRKS